MFGGFASSAEAKSASMSEAPSSSHFERAASAFNYPAPAARTVGCFTPSFEAKSASQEGAPMPSCSEQVTSALKSIIDSRTRVASKCVFLVVCRCLVVGQMSFRRQSLERFPCLFSVRLASFRSLS